MGLVAIQEQNLIDIGNSLRGKLGETKVIYSEEVVPLVKVSKSPNAISFTEYSGQYADRGQHITDIITIEGATKVSIKMAYQTFSYTSDDYISVTEGTEPNTSYSYEHRYYGTELNTVELEFNGDTVTFFLRILDAPQDRNALGFYAEVWGYDADGNIIKHIEGEKVVKNDFRAQDMANAIDSIEVLVLPDEAFNTTGTCSYKFAFNGWNWYINMFGNKIIVKDVTSTNYMFAGSSYLSEIPFTINYKDIQTGLDLNNMFQNCGIKKVPALNMPNATKLNLTNLFNGCTYLVDANGLFINEDEWCASWQSYVNTNQFSSHYSNGIFQHCARLRSLPSWFYGLRLNPESTSYPYNSYLIYANMLYYCYTIGEAVNIPVWKCKGYLTSNSFTNAFNSAQRLQRFTFETNADGSPIVTEWKAQTIDLTQQLGYMAAIYNATSNGITADKEVKDDATYQALKNDKDWFTCKADYCRYNHDSAVETINSLPDTSAYLATAGGTNTIKFKGAVGSLTDGGAINTLTAEEIAVATAKGWTVTLT